MASNIRIKVEGVERVKSVLRGIDPSKNSAFVRRALVKGGLLVQREAALNQIKRGGKGPSLRDRLTSRTGTGRRSIRVDRGGLSKFFVEIGSDLEYMKVHETGGTFQRRAHTRTSRLGNSFQVRAHQATYPARPFLKPALDAVDDELEGVFFREWQTELNRL